MIFDIFYEFLQNRHQEIIEKKKLEKVLEEERIKEEDKQRKIDEIVRYKQKKQEVYIHISRNMLFFNRKK